MARSAVRRHLGMRALCAGLLAASAWFIAACTDRAQAPTAPQARVGGVQRMIQAGTGGCDDTDPNYDICEFCFDNPNECDVAGGGGSGGSGASVGAGSGGSGRPQPLYPWQQSLLNQAYALIDPDAQGGQCGFLLNLAFSVSGGIAYDPATPYAGYSEYDSWNLPDYNGAIVLGKKAFGSARQTAITAIHEAAHVAWNLRDGSGGPEVAEWWGQMCLRQ